MKNKTLIALGFLIGILIVTALNAVLFLAVWNVVIASLFELKEMTYLQSFILSLLVTVFGYKRKVLKDENN